MEISEEGTGLDSDDLGIFLGTLRFVSVRWNRILGEKGNKRIKPRTIEVWTSERDGSWKSYYTVNLPGLPRTNYGETPGKTEGSQGKTHACSFDEDWVRRSGENTSGVSPISPNVTRSSLTPKDHRVRLRKLTNRKSPI